ncbi:MAG: GNAT family N-acetyltransferase [Sphingopyxis sp.]|nr:GNAT family N-acetyltransferase [Sphingopyxis sp.]
MTPPILETPRLRLREHRLSDKDAHVAMWADERVTRFIGGDPRSEGESWRRFLAAAGMWPILGYGYWVFADKATDQLIGMGGLSYFARGVPDLEGVPEAGWAFGADHWGQGLATEAMVAVFAWADAHLETPEIRCIINVGHSASEAVAAKLGFIQIGHHVMDPDPVNIFARMRRV